MKKHRNLNAPYGGILHASSLGMLMLAAAFGQTTALGQATEAKDATPRVLAPGFQLQLVLEAPRIVTPVAIVFDHDDQLLVIESHTHQRPDDYDGPPHDRIRRLIDTDHDGSVERIETFFEGTDQTMSLVRGPANWIYVATRRAIFRIRDTNGDGRANERESLVQLDTRGDYPHNGLSGLTFAPNGRLVFGMGENLGESYRLIASDAGTIVGGGEGGNVFTCRADGSDVQRLATGFWNPFGNAFDPLGRLFSVDNDPDSSPPCRLLHVVADGDYGYQFRYGRSGRHPLQAWDAELPGTLPMAAGTGEAPCQIVPYRGRLWVTSWGDFRIEAYTMHTVGATCQGQAEIIVQGDATFRPVGLAAAPDGSLYFSDWVARAYPVHRQGRIWRLVPARPGQDDATFPAESPAEQRAEALRHESDQDKLLAAALDDDLFIRQAASAGLAASGAFASIDLRKLESPRQRVAVLEAFRWQRPDAAGPWLDFALHDKDDRVCLLAMRMIAESRDHRFRAGVVEQLTQRKPLSARLGAVALATVGWLDEGQESKNLPTLHARLAAYLGDPTAPRVLRRLALHALPSDHPALAVDVLGELLDSEPELQSEIIAILADQARPLAGQRLAQVAQSSAYSTSIRADACAALSSYLSSQRTVLEALQTDASPAVRQEVDRTLLARQAGEPNTVPDIDALLADPRKGDAAAGRRVFFRDVGARCSSCHSYDGRGASVGPELTTIYRRADRRWLLETILDPNRDVAPRFTSVTIVTLDGRTFTGQLLPGPGDDAAESFVQSDGAIVTVPIDQIDQRHYQSRSIMPEGLGQVLDESELRDLIAFLLRSPD